MYGQMTAGSWIYIGTQGILQGTYETFAAAGEKHFGGNLAGRLVVTAGLGGMGGAQPLAATMNGGVVICVEVDPGASSGAWRPAIATWVDRVLDEALRSAAAAAKGEALSVGLLANAADVYPSSCAAAWPPTWSPTRPRPTTRERLRAQRHEPRRGARAAPRDPAE